MKRKKAVYVGLFVGDEDKRKIRRWYERVSAQPLLPNTFGHHITLKFKPSETEMAQLVREPGLGAEVPVTLTAVAGDSKAQAAVAKLPTGLLSRNPVPHLTLATSGATKPVYSNELLQGDDVKQLPFAEQLPVKMRLGFFNGKEPQFTEVGSIYE